MMRYPKNNCGLAPMMTREQRIEYEILNCALNGAIHSDGYATTVSKFTERLGQCFPDIRHQEFTAACERLFQQQALALRKAPKSVVGWLDYRVTAEDDAPFSADDRGNFYLSPAPMSRTYFNRLSGYLEAPAGFKPGSLLR